jgi:cytochrome b involved in lipid metabolism
MCLGISVEGGQVNKKQEKNDDDLTLIVECKDGRVVGSSSNNRHRIVSWEELREKNSVDECWIGYKGKVYDVTRWLGKHPGGLRSIMSTAGRDATSVMTSLHAPHTLAQHMRRVRQVGVLPADSSDNSTDSKKNATLMEKDFAELHEFFERNGWYERITWPYLVVLLRIGALWTAAMYLMQQGAQQEQYGKTALGSICLGLFFQNVAFIGHDIGHGSVTMSIALDSWLGLVVGNLWTGIDMSWWKATHYVHHSATNALDDDPDIQHAPIFCFDPGFQDSRFSTYHGRFLPQCMAFFIKRQHLYFHLVMAFARFNLYVQSILHLSHTCPFAAHQHSQTVTHPLTQKTHTKYAWHRPPPHRWLASVVSLSAFYAYYAWFFAFQMNNLRHVTLALLLSHIVAGILHVQILLSHVAMEYCNNGSGQNSSHNDKQNSTKTDTNHNNMHNNTNINNNAIDSLANIDTDVGYYQWQALSTMDIACHPLMDWFHGGLQFQLEHHMYPRLPRWRLRQAIPYVDSIFQKYDLAKPVRIPFITANQMVLDHLQQVGRQVASSLTDQSTRN